MTILNHDNKKYSILYQVIPYICIRPMGSLKISTNNYDKGYNA